jgi:hypothetical protein
VLRCHATARYVPKRRASHGHRHALHWVSRSTLIDTARGSLCRSVRGCGETLHPTVICVISVICVTS